MHQQSERTSDLAESSKDNAEPVQTDTVSRKDLIVIRDGVDDDKNFILLTWRKGLRYGNDWFELIEKSAYDVNYTKAINHILDLVLTEVKIACLKDSPDVILGYSVYTSNKLHYAFTRRAWRNIGIFKSLVPKNVDTVTHVTDAGRAILKKYPSIKFNPFL